MLRAAQLPFPAGRSKDAISNNSVAMALESVHWIQRVQESIIATNIVNSSLNLDIGGGSDSGSFCYIDRVHQDDINYHSGKIRQDDIILEVQGQKVAGYTLNDLKGLLNQVSQNGAPVMIKTVKNGLLPKDLRLYLNSRFQKNSVDHDLQQTIRDNLYLRTVPCTTRPKRPGELDGVDYTFLTVEEFAALEKSGKLLESGNYDGNHYGTPTPPKDSHTPLLHRTSSSNKILPGAHPSSEGKRKRNRSHVEMTANKSADPPSSSPALKDKSNENLGPLPADWEMAFTDDGHPYFIDHKTETTHWLDPRLAAVQKTTAAECKENDTELPFGWEKVDDPHYGTYFIDHVNRKTQYENPVKAMQREKRGKLDRTQSISSHATDAERMSIRTANSQSDLNRSIYDEKVAPFTKNPSELRGETYETTLVKSPRGFGFTIVGGDDIDEEFLQVKSVVENGPAHADGKLQTGDVLVHVNRTLVLGFTHQDIVTMFQSIPPGGEVKLHMCRGYPLPFDPNDPNTEIVTTIAVSKPATLSGGNMAGAPVKKPLRNGALSASQRSLAAHMPDVTSQAATPGDEDRQPDVVNTLAANSVGTNVETFTTSIQRGSLGFGFTIADTPFGQKIKQILDRARCKTLQENDILVEIDQTRVKDMAHLQVVQVLKDCPIGIETRLLVQRGVIPPSYVQVSPAQSFEDVGHRELGVDVGSTDPGQYFFKSAPEPSHGRDVVNAFATTTTTTASVTASTASVGVTPVVTPRIGTIVTPVVKVTPASVDHSLSDSSMESNHADTDMFGSDVADKLHNAGVNISNAPISHVETRPKTATRPKTPTQTRASTRDQDLLEYGGRHVRPEYGRYPENARVPEYSRHAESQRVPEYSRHAESQRVPEYSRHAENPRVPEYSRHPENPPRVPEYGQSMSSFTKTNLTQPGQTSLRGGNNVDAHVPANNNNYYQDFSKDNNVRTRSFHNGYNDNHRHGDNHAEPSRFTDVYKPDFTSQRSKTPTKHDVRSKTPTNDHVGDTWSSSVPGYQAPTSAFHPNVNQSQSAFHPPGQSSSFRYTPPSYGHLPQRQNSEIIHPRYQTEPKMSSSLSFPSSFHRPKPEDGYQGNNRKQATSFENEEPSSRFAQKPEWTGSLPRRSGGNARSPTRGDDAGPMFKEFTVYLRRYESGFGFRIIGGTEENSQVSVGHIVPGGAADQDQRLRTGDEIVSVDGVNVLGASHHKVVQYMGQASINGGVTIGVRRRTGLMRTHSLPETYPYDITVLREEGEGFGFVIISSVNKSGSQIGRIIEGSPAERCPRLHVGDRILAVNHVDISRISHEDIVNLIKESGYSVTLTIGAPAEDVVNTGSQRSINTGSTILAYPAISESDLSSRRSDYSPYRSSSTDRYTRTGPPSRGYSLESAEMEWEESEYQLIELHRGSRGFGFSIRGGQEFNGMPLYVLRIADGGAADLDGRVRVGDQLVEINGYCTQGMTHAQAIELIQSGGSTVRIFTRRTNNPNPILEAKVPSVSLRDVREPNKSPGPVHRDSSKSPGPAHRDHSKSPGPVHRDVPKSPGAVYRGDPGKQSPRARALVNNGPLSHSSPNLARKPVMPVTGSSFHATYA